MPLFYCKYKGFMPLFQDLYLHKLPFFQFSNSIQMHALYAHRRGTTSNFIIIFFRLKYSKKIEMNIL